MSGTAKRAGPRSRAGCAARGPAPAVSRRGCKGGAEERSRFGRLNAHKELGMPWRGLLLPLPGEFDHLDWLGRLEASADRVGGRHGRDDAGILVDLSHPSGFPLPVRLVVLDDA